MHFSEFPLSRIQTTLERAIGERWIEHQKFKLVKVQANLFTFGLTTVIAPA
jgi:hypothetical protein